MREERLRALMGDIVEWAMTFLGKTNQASIRAIFYEGKTPKQHSCRFPPHSALHLNFTSSTSPLASQHSA